MIVAGFYGGYAMMVRGGAFSNAQTGNVALMALELGQGHWKQAAACRFFNVKAIWLAMLPLTVLAADLLHADLTKEKNLLEQTPAGH